MPNITYKNTPGSGTLAAGASPTGVDVSENWYYPTATGEQSLEVINGHLDAANLDSSLKFENKHIQKGTISRTKMVGCTANIDYFAQMFGGSTTQASVDDIYDEPSDQILSREAVAIPGLGIRFYVPFSGAKCILQWSFNHQNDGVYASQFLPRVVMANGKNFPAFFLFVDGVMDHINARRYTPGAGVLDPAGNTGLGVDFSYGRAWSGHKLITSMTKGWHSADIRVMLPARGEDNNKVTQCRVRTRGMRYILFR
jgi:hypothetical protein